MASEIQTELEENIRQMNGLIKNQLFSVGDAEKFLSRYYNIVRKMEDLESSRDTIKIRLTEIDDKWKIRMEKLESVWREKNNKLKEKLQKIKGGKTSGKKKS